MAAILIVDDRVEWETLLQTAVREGRLPPIEIVSARSLPDAIAIINQRTFDAAIIDQYYADDAQSHDIRTGLDLAAVLRERTPDLPIILVTAHDLQPLRRRCDELALRLLHKAHGHLADLLIAELRDSLGLDS